MCFTWSEYVRKPPSLSVQSLIIIRWRKKMLLGIEFFCFLPLWNHIVTAIKCKEISKKGMLKCRFKTRIRTSSKFHKTAHFCRIRDWGGALPTTLDNFSGTKLTATFWFRNSMCNFREMLRNGSRMVVQKLLKYEHIIYNFKERDLEISNLLLLLFYEHFKKFLQICFCSYFREVLIFRISRNNLY